MDDSNKCVPGDGRLTVLLFFMFGLVIIDFIYCHHWSFFYRRNESNFIKQLCFVRPNKLVVEKYSNAAMEQGHVPIQAKKTPFFFELIPINSADKDMLMSVQGIGPALADDIVIYRQQFGPFESEGDLQNLKGIGPKRAAKFATVFTFAEVP